MNLDLTRVKRCKSGCEVRNLQTIANAIVGEIRVGDTWEPGDIRCGVWDHDGGLLLLHNFYMGDDGRYDLLVEPRQLAFNVYWTGHDLTYAQFDSLDQARNAATKSAFKYIQTYVVDIPE